MKFAWATLASAISLMAYLILNQLWAKSFLTGSVIIPALILMVAAKRRVPSKFLGIYTLATLMNVICMGWDLYNRIYHMDEVAHFFTSLAMAPALGLLVLSDLKPELSRRPQIFFLLSLSLTLAVGAGWEILEYLIRIEAYYDDTMTDLVADALGAAIGSIIGARHVMEKASE